MILCNGNFFRSFNPAALPGAVFFVPRRDRDQQDVALGIISWPDREGVLFGNKLPQSISLPLPAQWELRGRSKKSLNVLASLGNLL